MSKIVNCKFCRQRQAESRELKEEQIRQKQNQENLSNQSSAVQMATLAAVQTLMVTSTKLLERYMYSLHALCAPCILL